jgi:hypothetical protein
VLSRLAVALAALTVAAGFGVGIHQALSLNAGEKLLARPGRLTSARARVADRDFRRAARLNPGVDPAIDRGILAYFRHRPRRAERLLLAVTRREPQNIAAWAWLNNAARAAGDRRLEALSRAKIVQLRPLGTPPG